MYYLIKYKRLREREGQVGPNRELCSLAFNIYILYIVNINIYVEKPGLKYIYIFFLAAELVTPSLWGKGRKLELVLCWIRKLQNLAGDSEPNPLTC